MRPLLRRIRAAIAAFLSPETTMPGRKKTPSSTSSASTTSGTTSSTTSTTTTTAAPLPTPAPAPAPIDVSASGILAASNFSAGTIAPFTNPWSSANPIEIVAAQGRPAVARMRYAPAPGGSHELGLCYAPAEPIRYGRTIWGRGDVFIPSGYPGQNLTDYRKLVDWQGNGARIDFARVDALRRLQFDTYDFVNGQFRKTTDWTEAVVPDDRWTTLEVCLRTNSADNVQDGEIAVYLDGAAMPAYRRSGFSWITDAPVGEWKSPSNFAALMLGFQLTSSGTSYTEERYWDNVVFSTERIAA